MNQTLETIFSLFYDPNNYRSVFRKPFTFGGKTYATDGYALIFCDNEHIDFDYENEETYDKIESIIPQEAISKIIDVDSIDWNSHMTEDETVGNGNDVICGHCHGEGDCEETLIYKGKWYEYEYECPVCEGCGYEAEEKQIPTGNKTFKREDTVKVDEVYFNAAYFYKLKLVKDFVASPVEFVCSRPAGGNLFKVGFLNIIIMPKVSFLDDIGIKHSPIVEIKTK